MSAHGLAECTPHYCIGHQHEQTIDSTAVHFVCKCYFKWESPSRVRTEYIQMFPGEVPRSRFTIHEIVKKFETTGSVANKQKKKTKS